MSEFGLVVPFVVVESAGGPYDDDAYAAGMELGTLYATLWISRPDVWAGYVRTANVPQVDLVAMERGYAISKVPWSENPEEWTHVTLRATRGFPSDDPSGILPERS